MMQNSPAIPATSAPKANALMASSGVLPAASNDDRSGESLRISSNDSTVVVQPPIIEVGHFFSERRKFSILAKLVPPRPLRSMCLTQSTLIAEPF